MAERHVNVKAGGAGSPPCASPVGRPFVYRSSIWRIKGLYVTATPSGEHELRWILGEQEPQGSGVESGGDL
jgi:hypothetical protein